MENNNNKPTTTFWIIGVIALLWNIMGVLAYLGQAYMTDEVRAALPDADQAYYENLPAWVTAAFAIAVFAGAFGCIALLIRKKWATSLFIISFIGVIAQFIYNAFIQNDMEVTPKKLVWTVVVIAIAAFLIWYSKKTEKLGWIK